MDDKDLKIQDLRAENEKLKEKLEQLKKSKAAVDTDMDKLTTEMMEHICDNLCKHPSQAKDQDELDWICADCKMGKFVCDILNTYNRQMQQLTELKESSLDPIEMCKVKIALDKLKEYEERGILPPFNVGDTVYEIAHTGVERLKVTGFRLGKMMGEDEEEFEEEHLRGEWYFEATGPWYDCSRILSHFGKNVFLTEQEAQSALEKMKGE